MMRYQIQEDEKPFYLHDFNNLVYGESDDIFVNICVSSSIKKVILLSIYTSMDV
jgi:hypothetical protein